MDCKYQNDYESNASNKQIKVNILNLNYDKYMCLINFYT
jgi:hypothetical protein